jgi:uncharacterized membrane protein YccF (DUF307 family)
MKTLGNILWHFPFFGFVSAIVVYLIGTLLTITVIAAPIGLGLMEFGKFLFAPFGHTMISKADLGVEQNIAWKAYSTIVMVIYFPFGLFLAVCAAFQVFFLFCSVVGIPVALVIAKSLGTYLNPVNKKCVSSAVSDELERRKGSADVEKYLGPTSRGFASTVEDSVKNAVPVGKAMPTNFNTDQGVGSNDQPVSRLLFCTNCGTKIEIRGVFCDNCGVKLKGAIA